jgi:methionyl-tRNA formyltransferase
MKVAYMGTPDFAVVPLDALIDAGHDIVCVYAQPPRPAGRGHRERPTPVHRRAAELGLRVRTPASLKGRDEQRAFATLGCDVAVVAAYGLILPPAILAAPRLGCLNIHASLLPRWRGAAPIQHAIWAGDAETGITIMQMDAGLDTGPILRQDRVPIGPGTTAAALHDALARLGAEAIVAVLADAAAGRLRPRPQPEDGASYARKLTRDDGRLVWSNPADELARQVRGLNPWPGTWFKLGNETIRVLEADAVSAPGTESPGTVLAGPGLVIRCGDGGALRLRVVQRPGKRPTSDEAFRRGLRAMPSAVAP